MKFLKILLIGLSSFVFWGCASSSENVRTQYVIVDKESGEIRYKPIVTSENRDSRVILKLPKVLKVWIAPYVNESGLLVSGHDVYTVLESHKFVSGTQAHYGRTYGATSPVGDLPFSISPYEIDRSDLESDKVIIDFLDNADNASEGSVMNKVNRSVRFEEIKQEDIEKKKTAQKAKPKSVGKSKNQKKKQKNKE